ncbi:hypothetical protein K503DRAFT_795683 [Rhizopogon vinicolor AM-OR11-026]|uniref:Uncharacterized protein n=1 Tax=Rhizopogon vinicolor AM-OR11-026 TaxID=1314800 RepID=A0A1B7NHA5_9AGAM|nr:hypothetical protein K503DRAFT_795683 [Rhizopogon vinicolor AM-OR11-026]
MHPVAGTNPQPTTTSDYSLCTNPDFDVNDIASANLSGEPYPSPNAIRVQD